MLIRGKNITAIGNGTLAEAPGAKLVFVNVNTGASSAVLALYDGIDTSGEILATIDCSVSGVGLWYDITTLKGLHWVLSGGDADVTIGFE